MTNYKYTKKNCYEVAKSIIDGINYNNARGFDSSRYGIYLLEIENHVSGYVQTKEEGLWHFIYDEKNKGLPHTHNWIEITDWFRDMPPYTKKELADMIYEFYEVVE